MFRGLCAAMKFVFYLFQVTSAFLGFLAEYLCHMHHFRLL